MSDEYRQREHIARLIEDCPCDDCTSCLHDNKTCKGYETAKKIIKHVYSDVKELQSENAALRARLDKAIELPPGDRVWYIAEDEEGQESYIISKPTISLTVEELKYEMDKKYFYTREAAEKRLAELNGGKQ